MSTPALCTVDEFVATPFDFLVIGGGTAGSCVAARLTEDARVRVGVIEAGENLMDDPSVSTPGLYPTLIGRKKYDWCFESTPQPQAGNKVYSMPRGKALGGSSAINYLMYVRGSRQDYDGWAKLGNEGWDWEGMLPYFKKHEHVENQTNLHVDPQYMPLGDDRDQNHGRDGPIHVSFNDWYSPFEYDFCSAAHNVLGSEKTIKDAWSGDHLGFYSSLATVNRSTDAGKRSYAATGYLRPNLGRPNLKIITGSHVTKLVMDGKRATGVEFLFNGQTRGATCSKEVIMSAGVIQTPQILELSGIGDPAVLDKAKIPIVVENKAVGANFQDHVLGGLLFDLKPGVTSLDAMHDPAFAKEQQDIYTKTGTGVLGSPGMLMGFLSYAQVVASESELQSTLDEIKTHNSSSDGSSSSSNNSLAAKEEGKSPFERAQEALITDQLSDPTFANLQTFCIGCRLDVGKGSDQTQFFGKPPEGIQQVSLLICLEHPLSRGTVHIRSGNPLDPPEIDPGYLRHPADAKMMAAGVRWVDSVSRHPKMAQYLARRELPPVKKGGSDDDDDDILDTEEGRVEYVRNHISTQYHLIGTCSLGEAVDNRLRLFGAENIRVIDASVFPTHVSGNIMATTYAVAEKGADIIKEDYHQ